VETLGPLGARAPARLGVLDDSPAVGHELVARRLECRRLRAVPRPRVSALSCPSLSDSDTSFSHTHSLSLSHTLNLSLPPSLSHTHSISLSIPPSIPPSLTHTLNLSLHHSLPHSLTHTHNLKSQSRSLSESERGRGRLPSGGQRTFQPSVIGLLHFETCGGPLALEATAHGG
jgi:hypothetical protein